VVHRQELNEYPEGMKEEFLRLSQWIRTTREQYGPRVLIRLVDPQSLLGMWKALRNGVRRYPTFLVDGTERVVGWEGDPAGALAQAVERRGLAPAASGA
jgi:hypothetical protein